MKIELSAIQESHECEGHSTAENAVNSSPVIPKVNGFKDSEDISESSSAMSSPETSPAGPVNVVAATPTEETDEQELLRKLEEANRLLEADEKSLRSLSVHSNKTSNHSKSSGHSRTGSVTSIMSNTSLSSNLSFQYDEDDPEDLWALWGRLAKDWENVSRKKPAYIKELVRKGIPHHFRGIAWQLLCNSHNNGAKEAYTTYLKQTSPFEKVIRRDITRTYPEHDFFREKNGLGQESLFSVMKAYSLHDREVGYCQGSGFIVGLLLMQMPEEEAFSVLVQLMGEYRLRELYKPSMAELGLLMFQLECVMQEQLPDLYMHFQSHNFCVSMFASSWFLTLYTTALPLPVACRIFDVFLSEGMEVIFRVAFAILQQGQAELMAFDMEGMLRYFQKQMPARYECDPDLLLTAAFNIKYSSKKMKKLEKEYNQLKTREQEDQVELRRLRTENRLLRQRIDNLEKETGTLADRLIQDQVIRAQKEEEVFVLRRDISTLRQQNAEITQLYKNAMEELHAIKERASVVSSMENPPVHSSQEEIIQELKDRVSSMAQRDEDSCDAMKQLQTKISELENANQQLQKDPTVEMQQLQEELIACKLREAEANLSMKELRQRVTDLDKYWQKQLEKWNNPPESQPKPSKDKVRALQEEVMNVRLREAQSFAELQEMKQRVMELETQNQICNRQLKRMDSENVKLKEEIEKGETREKELQHKILELERTGSNIDSKLKEEEMMQRLKDAEHSQVIAEMRQRIAELEIENQELITADQLHEKGEAQALETRIADLQAEVMRLKMAKQLKNISTLALNRDTSADTESDYDTDDLDTTITDTHKLKLKVESRQRIDSSNSTGSWGDPMMCSLTEVDIERLRLQCPMSDSMMLSMTEADIDKLRLTSSMLGDPSEKAHDPMMDSMISDGSVLVDMRSHRNEDDADTESSEGEGLHNFEEGATIKRRVSKKKRKNVVKDGADVHINGALSKKSVEPPSSAILRASETTPSQHSQSDACDSSSNPSGNVNNDVTRTTLVTSSDSGVTTFTENPAKLNGAVCNGGGSEG